MKKISQISCIYFSPTGNTKRITTLMAETLSEELDIPVTEYNITLPYKRVHGLNFEENDLVIIGYPTYAGRVPNLLLDHLHTIRGNNTPCIPIVTFGNRAFDDALYELRDIMDSQGFVSIAAGAFVGRHSFTDDLGFARPNLADREQAEAFAIDIATKIKELYQEERPLRELVSLEIPGRPEGERTYYQPRRPDGTKVDMVKVTPQTFDGCIKCYDCSKYCPMGSIDPYDPRKMIGPCIKCNRCIRVCQLEVIKFTDEGYLAHVQDLVEKYGAERKPNFTVL